MALVDRHTNDFLQEVKKLDQELRHFVNSSEGLLHVQMGDFRAWIAAAISEGRFDDYARGIEILDRYFQPLEPRLESFNNAVYVSFLENLVFEGHNGQQAWAITPSKTQTEYTDFMTALEASAPKKLPHPTRKERLLELKKKTSHQKSSGR
ncbi:MAG: DUF7674 family protein [Deinococcus sp.]